MPRTVFLTVQVLWGQERKLLWPPELGSQEGSLWLYFESVSVAVRECWGRGLPPFREAGKERVLGRAGGASVVFPIMGGHGEVLGRGLPLI